MWMFLGLEFDCRIVYAVLWDPRYRFGIVFSSGACLAIGISPCVEVGHSIILNSGNLHGFTQFPSCLLEHCTCICDWFLCRPHMPRVDISLFVLPSCYWHISEVRWRVREKEIAGWTLKTGMVQTIECWMSLDCLWNCWGWGSCKVVSLPYIYCKACLTTATERKAVWSSAILGSLYSFMFLF